ncbi:MAG TPA: O-antigen ligase family protein [Gemmatimonadaceae bacterium]|nr:O-antigen ligase family protein [Gemmatimonadaceae bacterium]
MSTAAGQVRIGAAEAPPTVLVEAAARPWSVDRWGRLFVLVTILVWGVGFVLGFERALTVLVALCLAVAVVGLWQPTIGLLGVATLCALDTPARVYLLSGGLLRFNSFNYWLLAVMAISLPFLQRVRDPHSRLLQLFVLLLTVELFVTPNLVFGLQHVLNIAAPFALLVYFAPAAEGLVVWYWLGMATGMTGALGGLQFYLQRATLPEINPNAFALFPLTALFAICLTYSAARPRRGQLLLILLATVNWAWVFLSGSRGGLLMATLCIALLVFLMRGLGGRMSLVVYGVIGALVISTQFTDLQEHALHRIDRLFDSEISLVSRTSGRSELMRGGWEIFREHPFGVGTGGFADSWARLPSWMHLRFGRGMQFQSHSAWVKVLAENGFPGILLFAAYVASFAIAGLLARDWRLAIFGSLVTLVLAAAFGTTEFQAKGLWFLTAGATTLLHRPLLSAALRRPRIE